MQQNRIIESSNMLHYSNASSREKSRRYLVIKKGGLPGCSGKREGSPTPQSYWVAAASVLVSSERRGGRNNKYNANISMTMEDMTLRGARCALTRYEVVPAKGKNIQESITGVSRFQTDELKGESCVLAMLGICGGRTGYVFRFVSLF